jgi:hypothetical protein
LASPCAFDRGSRSLDRAVYIYGIPCRDFRELATFGGRNDG